MNNDRYFIFLEDLILEVPLEVYSTRYGLTGLVTKDYMWKDMICITSVGNKGFIWMCHFLLTDNNVNISRYFDHFEASAEEDHRAEAYILADKLFRFLITNGHQ